MSGLRIQSLEARAGAFVLGPLDLDLGAGGYGAVVGPSGAGKSTLLAALAGTLPAQGRVELEGRSLLPLAPEDRGVGLVPQGGLLFPHLTAGENVAFALRGADRARRAGEALEATGATELADRPVRGLSGGETMRVALARALSRRPRLLLLDEPLTALDPAAREPLRALLASLPSRAGIPVLHVTHDFDEACALGNRLGVLSAGRLLCWGAPAEIFARPPSAEVASFLGLENVLAGTFVPGPDGVSELRTSGIVLQVAGAFEGEGVATFPASAVTLALAPPDSSARNALVATVTAIEQRAGSLLVRLEASGVHLAARVTGASARELALAPGKVVLALVKATAVHAIPGGRR